MKNCLTLLMLLAAYGTFAQTINWDSTYRPGRWQQRVDNFRLYEHSKKDIVFLGNSITEYVEWNELLRMPRIQNRGISGDISFGVLDRLDEVTAGKPKKVFVMIGINDIARNIPDSVILTNYRRIIAEIKRESPKTQVYFQSLLPVNNTFPTRNHFNKDEHIATVNAGLKQICGEAGITFIDIHAHFLDAEKRLDKQFTYDGLHLNSKGYMHWVPLLKPFLK